MSVEVTGKDPVQGLVDYVLEVKPYHTKILEVLVEYVHGDTMDVTMTDAMSMCINIGQYKLNSVFDKKILSYDPIQNSVTVEGDARPCFESGQRVNIVNSRINDGIYIVDHLSTTHRYFQQTPISTWRFYHNQGHDRGFAQVTDTSHNVIIPANIFINSEYVEVEFNTPVSGHLALSFDDGSFYTENVGSSTTWTITHALNTSNVLIQTTVLGDIVYPDNIQILDDNNILVTFPVPVSGNILVAPVFNAATGHSHTQSEAEDVWDIPHNLLTKNIIVHVYDSLGNQIFPSEIQLFNNNRVRVEFPSNETGSVVIRLADSSSVELSEGIIYDQLNNTSEVIFDADFSIVNEESPIGRFNNPRLVLHAIEFCPETLRGAYANNKSDQVECIGGFGEIFDVDAQHPDDNLESPVDIISTDSIQNMFVVAGDRTATFPTTRPFRVQGSSEGNDGWYHVFQTNFDGTNTLIRTIEDIYFDDGTESGQLITYGIQGSTPIINVGFDNHRGCSSTPPGWVTTFLDENLEFGDTEDKQLEFMFNVYRATAGFEHSIVSINGTTNTIEFAGDQTTDFISGNIFTIDDGGVNNGMWIADTVLFNGTNTLVTVTGDLLTPVNLGKAIGEDVFIVLGDITNTLHTGGLLQISSTTFNDGAYKTRFVQTFVDASGTLFTAVFVKKWFNTITSHEGTVGFLVNNGRAMLSFRDAIGVDMCESSEGGVPSDGIPMIGAYDSGAFDVTLYDGPFVDCSDPCYAFDTAPFDADSFSGCDI